MKMGIITFYLGARDHHNEGQSFIIIHQFIHKHPASQLWRWASPPSGWGPGTTTMKVSHSLLSINSFTYTQLVSYEDGHHYLLAGGQGQPDNHNEGNSLTSILLVIQYAQSLYLLAISSASHVCLTKLHQLVTYASLSFISSLLMLHSYSPVSH